MFELSLPLAIMAITTTVALGLVGFSRHLLKMRDRLAPEVVHPKSAALETAVEDEEPHRLAA
jgi:hypothetical protein